MLMGLLCALVLSVVAAAAVAVVPSGPAADADPAAARPSSTPFKVGTEGYTCFRIPALVTTRSGTLLAFAEGRKGGCDDAGHNDIVMKRSLDGGATWQGLIVVVGKDDELANGNPVPVVDGVTGRVSLMYATGTWEDGRGPRTLHVVHSVDDGRNWRPGASLDHLKGKNWTWVSVGPGRGIQLTRGPQHGRLVITGDHDDNAGTDDGNPKTTVDRKDDKAGGQLYLSDDGGLTWRMGAVYEVPNPAPEPGVKPVPFPGEMAVAELTDGSLYVNARSKHNCGSNERRLSARSTEGGEKFATPFTPVPLLDAPPVYGSLLRLPPKDLGGTSDQILFSAPSRLGGSVTDRQALAIRSAVDGELAKAGTAAEKWPGTGTMVSTGRTGYSDMTLLSDGAVGLVYETATNTSHGNIHFTSYKVSEINAAASQVRVRQPRTTDAAVDDDDKGDQRFHRDDAAVHGDPVPADRSGGNALAFDGKDDYLRLSSCSPDLDLGQGDFTVTAWFRYKAVSGGHPLVWGYGAGDGAQQFFIKAEPTSAKTGAIRGVINTGKAYAEVRIEKPFNDGFWHHVQFKREGGQLHLSVDDTKAAPAPAAAGDISPKGPFEIHVGARPDHVDFFNGALDEIRIYDKALDADEAAGVRNGSVEIAEANERLRLGLTAVW
ncbi:sialidase family protein [Streptomyces sp. NPDC000410]|uniref:sialidase family protein n=1 Tax=Streptomyces sp. NPDC000410 TaxID=3154254 RepID=UPI00332AE5AE